MVHVLKAWYLEWHFWEVVEPLGGEALGGWGNDLERDCGTPASSSFPCLLADEVSSFCSTRCSCHNALPCHKANTKGDQWIMDWNLPNQAKQPFVLCKLIIPRYLTIVMELITEEFGNVSGDHGG
jgi:hypothetical protein